MEQNCRHCVLCDWSCLYQSVVRLIGIRRSKLENPYTEKAWGFFSDCGEAEVAVPRSNPYPQPRRRGIPAADGAARLLAAAAGGGERR